MSDFNPPSYNESSFNKSKDSFYQKPWFWVIIAFVVVIGLFQAGSTNNSSAPETTALVTTLAPKAQDTTTTTSTTQYVAKKSNEDKFIDFVFDNSPVAYAFTRSETLKFGQLVCGSLDEGNSVRSVVNILEQNAGGDSDVIDHFAAVMVSAIEYLCPQHKAALNRYLN